MSKRLVDTEYLNALELFYADAFKMATTERERDADRCFTRAWRLSLTIEKHIMKEAKLCL